VGVVYLPVRSATCESGESTGATHTQEGDMRTVKEMVNNNQKVRFRFYRDGNLWYETECGFSFPVPIAEAGTATFLAEDRAMLFMRYIRKQHANVEEGRRAQAAEA